MSTSFCVGYLSFSAGGGPFCQASVSYGAVASAVTMEVRSANRSQGFGRTGASALAEMEPVAPPPRPVVMQALFDWPAFANGRLSGVMAGKRPPRQVGSI